ncbi:esterase/lipase family protein [Evansella clarkii]|uniref:esterase/lipase family protein n=1 Tax=Evansella clarkii TaxID=79879 RepID=UPI001431A933|nr:hypothetical protein [Evansella clarkii]
MSLTRKEIYMDDNRSVNMPQTVFNRDDFAEIIGQPMKPGTIMIGNAPSGLDSSLPVIVFIQGLRNDSALWYRDNDMYGLAGAQFQTVFLELHDTAGVPKSNWENGELLASQLEQIFSYFEGRKLFLIGYSKGAVDAQTALIHFGKHHLVEGVVSIAAPHYGSELADLANSRPAGWLANLIGANNEGTKSLQTGVMNHFRAITDGLSEAGRNKYYTIAGDKAGPLLSLYSIGGMFIQGPSDGVVSVSSSRLPYGNELAVGDWNHAEVRLGTNVFPVFRETLKTPFPHSENHSFIQEESDEALAIFARGGKQAGTAAESFFVENGVERVVLNWVCSQEVSKIILASPRSNKKKAYDVNPVRDDAYFYGAWHHCIELDTPEQGEWNISVFTEEESAYLFLVKFHSAQNNLYRLVPALDKKSWQIAVPEAASYRLPSRNFNVTYEVDFEPSVNGRQAAKRPSATAHHNYFVSSKSAEDEKLTITLPDKGEGTYNTTINIEGFTPSGEKIQRTAVKTVYVDRKGRAY